MSVMKSPGEIPGMKPRHETTSLGLKEMAKEHAEEQGKSI